MPRRLAVRVASGLGVAAVAIAAILIGPPALTLLALAGGAIALHEVYRLTPPGVDRLPLALGLFAVAALLLAAEAATGTADYLTASGVALAVVGPGRLAVVHRGIRWRASRRGVPAVVARAGIRRFPAGPRACHLRPVASDGGRGKRRAQLAAVHPSREHPPATPGPTPSGG